MTSATLIYSPHLNEIPPQKRGLTGPSYTTKGRWKTGEGHRFLNALKRKDTEKWLQKNEGHKKLGHYDRKEML